MEWLYYLTLVTMCLALLIQSKRIENLVKGFAELNQLLAKMIEERQKLLKELRKERYEE